MLHTRAYATHVHVSRPHPDPTRIAGFAAAIAFNAALLLLLLIPLSAPPLFSLPDVIEPIRWILPKVDPPKPPIQVPVTRPQAPTRPTVTGPQTALPTVTEQVVVDQGTLSADPDIAVPAAATANEIASNIAPLPGVRLEYADAPAPSYPRDALHQDLEGTVLLQVLVDTDGRPLEVRIQQSSGHRQLDDAARRHVLKRWTFRPAMQDGRAVRAIGLVPIAFSLDY